MRPAFDIGIGQGPAGAVLTVHGDLDIATVGLLAEARERALAERPGALLIDLSAVAFIDSSGLRFLLQTHTLAQREGWKLELVSPAEPAMKVFTVTGADQQLPFIDVAKGQIDTLGEPAGDDESEAPRAVRLEIDPTPEAPRTARFAVQELVAEHPTAATQLDAVRLLVSEIVTNAVIHPGAASPPGIEFSAEVTPELTRVVVSDGGAGFQWSADQFPRSHVGGGYGIFLLDSQASRWGTLKAPGRFSVWFEIDHTLDD